MRRSIGHLCRPKRQVSAVRQTSQATGGGGGLDRPATCLEHAESRSKYGAGGSSKQGGAARLGCSSAAFGRAQDKGSTGSLKGLRGVGRLTPQARGSVRETGRKGGLRFLAEAEIGRSSATSAVEAEVRRVWCSVSFFTNQLPRGHGSARIARACLATERAGHCPPLSKRNRRRRSVKLTLRYCSYLCSFSHLARDLSPIPSTPRAHASITSAAP